MRNGVHIRWMIRRDMPAVLSIERDSFGNPWEEEVFIKCLRQRNAIGMVAEDSTMMEEVVGFVICELHKTRLHILNFAVAANHRRNGVGTAMLDKMVSKLSVQRRPSILLEVRETNLPAQLFFRKAGFRAVSVLRDFYEDSEEDGYQFEYRVREGATA